jgi:hypothetical protein
MSSSQQQNKFTLLPKETKTLSEISMNVEKNDALKVYLFIKDEKLKTNCKRQFGNECAKFQKQCFL